MASKVKAITQYEKWLQMELELKEIYQRNLSEKQKTRADH